MAWTFAALVLVCVVLGKVQSTCQQEAINDSASSAILDAIKDVLEQLTVLQEDLMAETSRRHTIEEKLDTCIAGAEGLGLLASTTESTPPTTTTLPLWSHVCEEGFSRFETHCYLYDTTKRDWNEARTACRDKGANLVSVNSKAEQDYIVSHLPDKKNSYWLGMTWVPPGKLIWLDGTEVDFSSWGQGNPNCMDTVCKAFLSVSFNHSWEDAGRKYKSMSVCESDLLLTVPYKPSTTTAIPTTSIPTTPVPVCPLGFLAFESHCYLFEMFKVSWERANEECKNQGSYMVSINTEDEQDFIVNQINSYYKSGLTYYWLGMKYMKKEDKLQWEDGTDVIYTAWGLDRFDCMKRGCHAFLNGGHLFFKWYDIGGIRDLYYICERDHLQIGEATETTESTE